MLRYIRVTSFRAGAILLLLICFQGCKDSALHYDFYFVSSGNNSPDEYENVVSFNSIKINRTVSRPSFTIDPDVMSDSRLRRRYLDSITNSNYLSVILLVPYNIKSDFTVRNLKVEVFRKDKGTFGRELQLLSVFVSDLKKFYNSYYFKGKKFSDFNSVKIDKGDNLNNILAAADYDLSSISDTVFVIHTEMELIVADRVKSINAYDTVIQKTKVSKVSSIRAH